MRPLVPIVSLGRSFPYQEALKIQRASQSSLINLRKLGQPQPGAVFLLEHPPVYTLGRGSKEEFILDKSVEAVRIERGGEVTFHGPGQLVGYLVLDLEFFKKDLHWLVRQLEDALMNALLKKYAIEASRVQGKSGVWVGRSKVAAVGLGAKQWVTIHGFALNIEDRALEGFRRIVPCGIQQETGMVTSIETILKERNQSVAMNLEQVALECVTPLEHSFGMTLSWTQRPAWLKEILAG
jgi:lipoyl(octanoyl) transferase